MKQALLAMTLAAICLTATSSALADRFATLAGLNKSVSVGSTETALMVYVNEPTLIEYQPSGQDAVRLTIPGGSVDTFTSLPLVGPATITLRSATAVVGLRVVPTTYTPPPATNAAACVPSNAVVVPTNATGPVNVLLESSVDMVTWNAASPGTYGSSTVARFFRVRAVQSN